MWYVSKRRQIFCSNTHKLVFYELIYDNYITVLPFFIEMANLCDGEYKIRDKIVSSRQYLNLQGK
jgi:hypothetical protein